MKNISPEICRQIGRARRAQDISQSALADEIGCRQPALSAFEAGDGTKLSEATVRKLAERFNISLEQHGAAESGGSSSASMAGVSGMELAAGAGYCPSCRCPSNFPYIVEGQLFLYPSRKMSAPVPGAKRCAVCGEVLEKRCPSCGAALNDGACCAICGMPYVTPTLPPEEDVASWVRIRREEISALQAFGLTSCHS